MEMMIIPTFTWNTGSGAESPASVRNMKKPEIMASTIPVHAQG